MTKKTFEESILNMHKNNIDYLTFKEIANKINYGNVNLAIGNKMKINEWVDHYQKRIEIHDIGEKQIELTFEHLENFHEKSIQLLQPKANKIYQAKNPAEIVLMNLEFKNEEAYFEMINKCKNSN